MPANLHVLLSTLGAHVFRHGARRRSQHRRRATTWGNFLLGIVLRTKGVEMEQRNRNLLVIGIGAAVLLLCCCLVVFSLAAGSLLFLLPWRSSSQSPSSQ